MSVTDVERGLIARYAVRVLSRTDLPVRSARQVVGWLYERHETMSFQMPSSIVDVLSQQYTAGYRYSAFEAAFASVRGELVAGLEQAAKESQRPEPLASNVENLVLALAIANPDAAWKIIGLITVHYEPTEGQESNV